MASPPPLSALSPPAPHSASLPSKKRPSLSTQSSSHKRRKPSTASSVAAPTPLRQTSYPPEVFPASAGATSHQRAPSVSSSAVGGSKRGRKKKNRDSSVAADGKSVVSTGTPGRSDGGAGGTASAKNGEGDGEDEDDEDGEDGEGGEVRVQGSRAMDEVQEKEREKILIAHFTPEQQTRWEAYRRVKPSPKTIKAIANRALSQSIPARVAIALNGMTKSYAGGIIERARAVQEEWAAAEKQNAPPASDPLAVAGNGEGPGDFSRSQTITQSQESPALKQATLGPLLPEHLREAVRRHKRALEGGGAGARGLSMASGLQLGYGPGVGGSVEFVAPARAARGRGRLFR